MEMTKICSNQWCKARFSFSNSDLIDGQEPKTCKKCQSFDKELSGGVTWQDREYEGNRYTNEPHQITYKVTNFKL
jgi:hypothetical protein